MHDEHPNKARFHFVVEGLAQAGLSQYLPAIKGSEGAIDLQHIMLLKEKARESAAALESALADSGIEAPADRTRVAAVLINTLKSTGGFSTKPVPTADAKNESEAWNRGLADESGGLPADVRRQGETAAADDSPPQGNGSGPETWPPGMKIVNPQLANSIREQGMLQPPNAFGYIHLAAELERPGPLRKSGPEKRALLDELKIAAKALEEGDPEVNRADVFDAFIIPPGSKEGRRVIEKGHFDLHVAEFDIVVLVECASVEAAGRVRQSKAFADLQALLEAGTKFVHCITAKNPKRIAEVDKTRDGVFLFNYFFAADIAAKGTAGIDILLGVWEYTAGWWTAKANLTNSTPLLPVEGERSQYSLINHCRWDRSIDVFPHLIFRPTLGEFVLKNFTANDIMAMPILYHLA
jgi:hypothetical protein